MLNAVLDIALLRYGAAGIALSTSFVTVFNAAVLTVALRARVGSLHGREVVGDGLRVAVATVYCAVAAFGVWWPLDSILGRSIPAQIVSLAAGLACGGAAFLTAAHLLAIPEVAVLRGLAGRFIPRRA